MKTFFVIGIVLAALMQCTLGCSCIRAPPGQEVCGSDGKTCKKILLLWKIHLKMLMYFFRQWCLYYLLYTRWSSPNWWSMFGRNFKRSMSITEMQLYRTVQPCMRFRWSNLWKYVYFGMRSKNHSKSDKSEGRRMLIMKLSFVLIWHSFTDPTE